MLVKSLQFKTHHLMRSALGLCVMVALALQTGGSVPDQFRRYIVTAEDKPKAEVQAELTESAPRDWQSVGYFVAKNDLLQAMSPRERALVRVAYQQEIVKAQSDNTLRARIRMPVLPGPVEQKAPATADRQAYSSGTNPQTDSAQPASTKTQSKSAQIKSERAAALAEDLATIEAFKSALRDLQKQGMVVGNYRNDIVDQ